MSQIGCATHWCGESRLDFGTATSFSTFVGHIYRCGSNGSCVKEAYASTVEEVVCAYNTAFSSHNTRKSEGMVENGKTEFVWVDLHGVPPPPHDVDNANRGNAMDYLWETLQLNQKHQIVLREEVAQEHQRRASLIERSGLDTTNTFLYTVPVTKMNDERALVIHAVDEKHVTRASGPDCFCAGYISEEGLENLNDPDSVHLYEGLSLTNGKGGAGGKFYVALSVAAMLEHIMQYASDSEEQTHSVNLTTLGKKHDMFCEISHISHDLHVNPFLGSVNLASDPVHINVDENPHVRSKSESTKNDSFDHLLSEDDEYNGAIRLRSDEHISPPQFAIIHVFCWRGLCVTWCPRSTSISCKDHRCLWQAKNWSQLRETVLSQCVYSPQCSLQPEMGESSVFHTEQGCAKDTMTTACFVSWFISTVCYTYLPNVNALLSEVEAIDFMMPLILPKMESDQSDVHRRILMLRHRLSTHRRELTFKKALLNSLRGPSINTLAAFMTQSYSPDSQQQTSHGFSRKACSFSAPAAVTALSAVDSIIEETLAKMDTSRMVLGNTTILYNSNVISSNYEISNDADYFMVLVHYVFITILPAHIITGQWGLNFAVPFKDIDSLTPFWVIVGVLVGACVLALIYPFWAYNTGRIHLIM